MKIKYIIMAHPMPFHVIAQAWGVRIIDCVCVTKQNRGQNIMGMIPKGLKVLRYRTSENYKLDDVIPIPDDWQIARDIRNALIDEAKHW